MSDGVEGISDLVEGGAGTIDTAHFRSVLGHFATGIVVVTGVLDGVPSGLTCQSFVSLSLDPALVAFCPSKRSGSWKRIQESGAFCANVLTEDQEEVSRVFATSGADKFRGIGWRSSETGSPILQDVLAWVDCRIEARHDAGDHDIIVGRVVGLEAAPRGRPLLAYRGGYGRFDA
ncbi:MAG: 3-hydroxy-9,10-secoandrosta,3,5(10)-triene-9,17-dione monooxygenase reductase component [Acidimicrobiaceae bacterium]|nr:3-hydroxy-9,10-secoandrosta,3,5(10)-triene-9,17-dione monooxygenase reductase component [Acidimicrobiaceae bacterium]